MEIEELTLRNLQLSLKMSLTLHHTIAFYSLMRDIVRQGLHHQLKGFSQMY